MTNPGDAPTQTARELRRAEHERRAREHYAAYLVARKRCQASWDLAHEWVRKHNPRLDEVQLWELTAQRTGNDRRHTEYAGGRNTAMAFASLEATMALMEATG